MKVDIGLNIEHLYSTTKVDLPRNSEAFYNIVDKQGRFDFNSGIFAFNSDSIELGIEIDGREIFRVVSKDIKDIFGDDEDKGNNTHPIRYLKDSKSILINFGLALQVTSNLKIYAKSSTSSSNRDLKGYSVFLSNGRDV